MKERLKQRIEEIIEDGCVLSKVEAKALHKYITQLEEKAEESGLGLGDYSDAAAEAIYKIIEAANRRERTPAAEVR